jgi:uncharacterized protein YbcV (DUF1398 family)
MKLLNNFKNAMAKSEKVRPKIGGFPYLAECLREEGFTKNTWYLPSGDSFYFTKEDSLIIPGTSLIEDITTYPPYSKEKLISTLRADQSGQTTFPEFLMNTWKSGIVKYEVNFIERYVIYYGANNEEYKETYPAEEIN